VNVSGLLPLPERIDSFQRFFNGKILTQISDKPDEEVGKFGKEEAIQFKVRELAELYGIEKEIVAKKSELEAELSAREKAVSERETELAELHKRASALPKEL
jgi:hypothetical protein